MFKIVPDGAAYSTVYTDVNFLCHTCGIMVNKVYYSERTGVAEWICTDKHLSRDKIGV